MANAQISSHMLLRNSTTVQQKKKGKHDQGAVTHISTVRDESGRSQIASDPGHDVNDTNPQWSSKFLQISHQVPLNDDGNYEVEHTGVQEQGGPQAVKLVRRVRLVEGDHPANVIETGDLRTPRKIIRGI